MPRASRHQASYGDKLKGDYEAASAAGAAALPKAIDAQNAMTTTVNSYGDKLKALAAMSTSR